MTDLQLHLYPAPPYLDIDAALQQLRGDVAALRLLGHVFESELPGYLLALDNAWHPNFDRAVLGAVLQRLRTTFGLFKCTTGQAICTDLIYVLALQGPMSGLLLSQLETVLAGLAQELANYCDQEGGAA